MTPISEDSGVLREWAPLATLLQKIPLKIQNGLFMQDINFTCIDAVPEFIAVGTNQGYIYWFNRESGELQRLKCENSNNITCIRVTSTVDFMVAAGSTLGNVTIFQIPKEIPDSLPESLRPKVKKQVERFNICGLHKAPVTTVEWSKNGMKLFSGDQDGLVVLTEIDFYMHLSRSFELVHEKYPVVQLSYHHGLLLVSTIFRTILVDRNQNDKVTQVGQKERKIFGKFGASFCKSLQHIQEPIIFASRPGLRIWQADKNGTVLKTLIFKDAIQSNLEVELLNPAPTKAKNYSQSFGVLKSFSEDLLVTYSNDIIYVVNPSTIAITSVITELRKIIDVSCSKDEIFVLEGDRNIVRISYQPETCSFNKVQENLMDPLSVIENINNKPVSSTISGFTSKLKESSFVSPDLLSKIKSTSLMQSISILPPVAVGMDVTSITNAEEALEIPPVLPLDINASLITEINVTKNQVTHQHDIHDRKQIFEKISEQDFEDVVFTPKKKTKKPISLSEQLNSSKSKTDKTVIKTTHSSLLTLKMDNKLEKPYRNLESIQKDVEVKEKLLEDVLTFDLSKYMTKSQINPSIFKVCNVNDKLSCSEYNLSSSNNVHKNKDSNINKNYESAKSYSPLSTSSYSTDSTKVDNLEYLASCSKKILEKKLDEPWKTNNEVDIKQMSEKKFNELSLKFVKSTMTEENEDWVLLG